MVAASRQAARDPADRRQGRRVAGRPLRAARRPARRWVGEAPGGSPWPRPAGPHRARRGYRDAWVLMDRVHDADDNGERLFEYLRASRPDINAWFVLEAAPPTGSGSGGAGGPRLVALRVVRWTSAPDAPTPRGWSRRTSTSAVISPRRSTGPRATRPGTFAFLQHGVIKDDLSAWLNTRDIDLFVTSTAPRSWRRSRRTGRRTGSRARRRGYTGLPRFDRLLAKGGAVPEAERNLVIIAPTWRTWLTLAAARRGHPEARAVCDVFWGSDYELAWSDARALRGDRRGARAARLAPRVHAPSERAARSSTRCELPASR